jgi:hypothetical protein
MSIKISELDPVVAINGGEFIPVVQDGETKKAKIDDTLGYKVYRAIVSYNATTEVFTTSVEQDTFLDITITKPPLDGVFYFLSDDDQYTENKTLVFISQNNNKGNITPYNFVFYTAFRQNSQRIILTGRAINSGEQEVDGVDLLTELSIEIRVYP